MDQDSFMHVQTNSGSPIAIPKRLPGYEVRDVIGSGGSGVVVSLWDIKRQELVAGKVLQRPEANTEHMRALERELRLATMISNPYLVACMGVLYLENIIILLMEYVGPRTLVEALKEDSSMVARYWKKIFGQLCLAVQYLHGRGIAHRDIKLENVMIDEHYNVRLCDYGVLREATPATIATSICGTYPYMAPEMVRGRGYSPQRADIWALGIALFGVVTGTFPWQSESMVGVIREITNGITGLERLPRGPREIVAKCCAGDPEKRPTVDEILEMPLMKCEMWSIHSQCDATENVGVWERNNKPCRLVLNQLIGRQMKGMRRKSEVSRMFLSRFQNISASPSNIR